MSLLDSIHRLAEESARSKRIRVVSTSFEEEEEMREYNENCRLYDGDFDEIEDDFDEDEEDEDDNGEIIYL